MLHFTEHKRRCDSCRRLFRVSQETLDEIFVQADEWEPRVETVEDALRVIQYCVSCVRAPVEGEHVDGDATVEWRAGEGRWYYTCNGDPMAPLPGGWSEWEDGNAIDEVARICQCKPELVDVLFDRAA